MFILVVSFFSFFLLLSKSLLLKPLPRWASEMRLLTVLFFQELLSSLAHLFGGRAARASSSLAMSPRKRCAQKAHATEEPATEMSVLDLPELALECILERLSPAGLCNMAAVCSSLRERCTSDYLWEKHMREKWGKVIGPEAHRQWKLYVAAKREAAAAAALSDISTSLDWTGVLSSLLPISWFKSAGVDDAKIRSSFAYDEDDSIMAWYRAIESGQLWFPAQVYNREQGHVGFMLSCYDAEVCYDCRSDTFRARYPPHGRRAAVIEEGVQWDRLRAIPVDTPAHSLHVSDCLNDLRPGDHIEIQWRRNKDFPYGWWYGVIGHLDSCDGSEHFCRCHRNDTVILEFNQYSVGSRWRCASIDRKEHREEGSESDGFYGGIRKLQSKEEISRWRQHWPTDALE